MALFLKIFIKFTHNMSFITISELQFDIYVIKISYYALIFELANLLIKIHKLAYK